MEYKYYILTERIVEPGLEEKLGVPEGTKVVYYMHYADEESPSDFSSYGPCAQGLTPSDAFADLMRFRQCSPTVSEIQKAIP